MSFDYSNQSLCSEFNLIDNKKVISYYKTGVIEIDSSFANLLEPLLVNCKNDKSFGAKSFGFKVISNALDNENRIFVYPILIPITKEHSSSILGVFKINNISFVCYGNKQKVFTSTKEIDSIPIIQYDEDSSRNVLIGNSDLLDFNSPPQIQIMEIQNVKYQLFMQPCNSKIKK
jgi:hypothetical protein